MTETQAIKGVFFDLDGTLMDTADDFIYAVNQLSANHGKQPIPENIVRSNVSAGSRTLVSLALGIDLNHPELEPKRQLLLEQYAHRVNNHSRQAPATLYPGINALLNELEQKNITWGVVTNKPEAYANPLLEQVQLHKRSSAIICPEHVKKPKPDPQALLLACEQACCPPEQCIYIGDHQRDIEAGKKAGMATVAALYGYIAEDDNPDNWQADFQAHNVYDIHQWLTENNWQVPA